MYFYKGMMRPSVYRYWDQLIDHIGDASKIFDGELVYPRQLEIHLPGDGKRHCNFNCFYCAGRLFKKELGSWELEGLELIRNLGNSIPYHIHGGSFTEPIMNPYLMAYLAECKRNGCHFGIHTNGSMLKRLEENQGWITELCDIADDKVDYLSVSLDAGRRTSHWMTKGTEHYWFAEIIEGIRLICEIRENKPAVRICYLMNEHNSFQHEIDSIVKFAKEVEADSLRFSIPFAHYAQSFDNVRKYKRIIEQKHKNLYFNKVEEHLSEKQEDQPFIFWMSPDLQDIDLFTFKRCAYGYYQICLGADGYVYRCTTISAPTFKHLRLGKITSNLEEFEDMIQRNQDPCFNTDKCFSYGARCNRMGIDINTKYRDYNAWRNIKNA